MLLEIDRNAEISIDKIPLHPLYRISVGPVNFIVSLEHANMFLGLTSDNYEVRSTAIERFVEFAEQGAFNNPGRVEPSIKEGIVAIQLSRVFRYFGLGMIVLSLNPA